MKYNDNGEWKNLKVKAFDTLPVGSVVEYDGEEVPDGYEKYVDINLKGKILWQNSNPSSNITDATTINLSSSDYDVIEVFYKYTTTNNNIWSKRIIKGYGAYLDIAMPYYTSANNVANEYRIFTRVSDTQYTLSNCKITHTSSTNLTRDDFIIPIYIVGYKTGLFS